MISIWPSIICVFEVSVSVCKAPIRTPMRRAFRDRKLPPVTSSRLNRPSNNNWTHTNTHTDTHRWVWLTHCGCYQSFLCHPWAPGQVCTGVWRLDMKLTSDRTVPNCRGMGSMVSRTRMEARLKSTGLTKLLNLTSSLETYQWYDIFRYKYQRSGVTVHCSSSQVIRKQTAAEIFCGSNI